MGRVKPADVAVGILLVLLLGTFSLAQIGAAEEVARRVKCAANLRQIGQAILLYSNENRGAYPRAVADMNKPVPVWGTPYQGNDKLGAVAAEKADPFDAQKSEVAPKPNDVTAALYLLLRTQDITSDVFICPSTGSEPFAFGGGGNKAVNFSNWPGNKALAEHMNYSYQNPYPTKEAIGKGFKLNNAIGAEFAIASDMNPGVDDLLKVHPKSPAREMRKGNSPNHNYDGQNVLYGDGHVSFEANPFVGVKRDNIYTFGPSGNDVADKGGDGIIGPTTGPDDSILLPTAKDLGVVDARGEYAAAVNERRANANLVGSGAADVRAGTPEEQAATRRAIQGNYVREENGRTIKLTVAADRVSATQGPVTVAFTYAPEVLGQRAARLTLSAPDTPPSAMVIQTDPDGGITIKGSPFLEGKWKKQ